MFWCPLISNLTLIHMFICSLFLDFYREIAVIFMLSRFVFSILAIAIFYTFNAWIIEPRSEYIYMYIIYIIYYIYIIYINKSFFNAAQINKHRQTPCFKQDLFAFGPFSLFHLCIVQFFQKSKTEMQNLKEFNLKRFHSRYWSSESDHSI